MPGQDLFVNSPGGAVQGDGGHCSKIDHPGTKKSLGKLFVQWRDQPQLAIDVPPRQGGGIRHCPRTLPPDSYESLPGVLVKGEIFVA